MNAGIAEYQDQFFTDTLDAEIKLAEPDQRTLTIDMDAASDSVKLAIYYLRWDEEGGRIILTSSLAGYLASAGVLLYSVPKHGMCWFTASLFTAEAWVRDIEVLMWF